MLKFEKRPEHYQPPKWSEVHSLLGALKKERKPRIDRIWELKRARRNQWNDTVKKLPEAFRELPFVVGESDIPDMISRIVGLTAKNEPMPEVMPPSPRAADVNKAAKEEARLHALRIEIQDQLDVDVYRMGIDQQAAWGESWISVWPEAGYFDDDDYKRGEDEDADEYSERFERKMAADGVPIRYEYHDPQTVYPVWGDRGRLAKVILESEHAMYEMRDVHGYRKMRSADGKKERWDKWTIGAARVPQEQGRATLEVDIDHDNQINVTADSSPPGETVTKTIYCDPFVCIVYLDGDEVERWEHDTGYVPIFYAAGKQNSDKDPAWNTEGIADVALVLAQKLVLWSALLTANGWVNGMPTPFLKGAAASMNLVDMNGKPITRSIKLGKINLLAPQEEIEFPMLDARMGEDFHRNMEYLSQKLQSATLGAFDKALGTDIAGYALAQIRAMQMAVLDTLNANSKRQWRKIYYFQRHIIRKYFKAGIMLRGAIDEDDESGEQYRPNLKYGPADCTDFPIEVHIDQGIVQDELAMRKSAIEMGQAGYWSDRRVMEETGVTDPQQEKAEINSGRMLNSPAADQLVLNLAMQMVTERFSAATQAQNTPFNQALQQVKEQMFPPTAGMPGATAGEPVNANPGGQPIAQNPAPDAPQQGGPTAGPPAGGPAPSQQALGLPGIPGGVKGAPQVPAGV